MEFETPLVEGRLVRRYKRFFADVELATGDLVVAHCPNPGSMATCAAEGCRVWLRRHDSQMRKLKYTWELAQVDTALICVNTGRANLLIAEALAQGAIPELGGYEEIRREVAYGQSRVDFVLSRGAACCYVEVKSVTLSGGQGIGAFPDSVTARGTKHLHELMAAVADGHRAVLLFCVNRSDAESVQPADDIDPLYGYTLRLARDAGVELLAYRTELSLCGMRLGKQLAINLPPLAFTPPPARASKRKAPATRRGAKKSPRPRTRPKVHAE